MSYQSGSSIIRRRQYAPVLKPLRQWYDLGPRQTSGSGNSIIRQTMCTPAAVVCQGPRQTSGRHTLGVCPSVPLSIKRTRSCFGVARLVV
eukprot:4457173-Prymnesium_polylepis.1